MSTSEKTAQTDTKINPLAMSVADAAKILSAVGVGQVSEKVLKKHIAARAPTNADGSISIVAYAAWLNERLNREAHHGTGL